MTKKIRFGMIGAGRIARKFARGLSFVEDAELVAIASRSMERADEFGDEFAIEKRYGSYQDLVQDEEIDVIYISTPNTLHKEHTILCLENKKAVICEKPFATTRSDVEEMIQVAKDNGVFLMEAMWTRYFPIIKKVRDLVDDGVIGDIKMIKGDFGFKSETKHTGIRFDKDLGGGSVFDVGVYPISFSSMIYKKQPKDIKVIANVGKTGVDEQAAMILAYDDGEMALLSSAITTQTPHNIHIIGDEGYIHIPDVWYAQRATLKIHNKQEVAIELPINGNGYNYEAEEVIKCLRNGQLESDIMPLNESLDIMRTLEELVRKIKHQE